MKTSSILALLLLSSPLALQAQSTTTWMQISLFGEHQTRYSNNPAAAYDLNRFYWSPDIIMAAYSSTDPITQQTTYFHHYDQAQVFWNGSLISSTTWNENTHWWSFAGTYSPYYSTAAEAVASMQGNYTVNLLAGSQTFSFGLSLSAIPFTDYSNIALTSDLWSLAHNQSDTLSWTNVLPNPDYRYASAQAGTAPLQYGNWTQGNGTQLVGATEMTTHTLRFGSPFDTSGLFQVGVSMGQTFDISSAVGNLEDPDNLLGTVRLREYSTRLVIADSPSNLPHSPVPEPSTYGLMGAATLASLAWLRRRGNR